MTDRSSKQHGDVGWSIGQTNIRSFGAKLGAKYHIIARDTCKYCVFLSIRKSHTLPNESPS